MSGVPDGIGDLAAALDAADAAAARHALRELPPEDAAGTALDLLARYAARGSAMAVELFVEQLDTTGVVHRFVRSALLDEAAIDDVAQDSLIAVASSVGSFEGTSKATTWVHSIVRRRVTDHLRRQRATSPLPADDLGPGERMSSMIATRATVQETLAALPDLYREPVTLRDIEGLAYADISERLGRSLSAVKSQVARGRALVAASLGAPESMR